MSAPVTEISVAARLQTLVDWERAPRGAMRVDLEPQRDLLRRLGDPHRRFRSVHVTGSKGKGSVCALIEAGLLHAGLRAGRYASPHVEHVTERICHLGVPVSQAVFDAATTRALDARDAAVRAGTAGARATWFDVVTAAAFHSFAQSGLDWAVVEVGMGGLSDSTNVIEPELAVITNVALEHVDVLGPTLESIAAHKAGVVRPGRPVLSGMAVDTVAGAVIRQRATELGSVLHLAAGLSKLGWQERNLAMARRSLDLLGFAGHRSRCRTEPLSAADLSDAVAFAVRLPGRMERFVGVDAASGRRFPLVLDGAHVGFAIADLLQSLAPLTREAGPPVVLLALAADKRVDDVAAALRGRVREVVCTALPDDAPCHAPGRLADRLAAHGIAGRACAQPHAAFADASRRACMGGWLLATGSFRLVGLLRPALRAAGQAVEVSAASGR